MIKVKWDLEEAVMLYDLYFKSGQTLAVNQQHLENLSISLNKRAKIKGFIVDEKFRNVNGLNMQIGCIHYVVTEGAEGLSNASKLFYTAYDLYQDEPEQFNAIVNEFHNQYD